MKTKTFLYQLLLVCLLLAFPAEGFSQITIKGKQTVEKTDFTNLSASELCKTEYRGVIKASEYTPTIMTKRLQNKGSEGSRYLSVGADEIWNSTSRDFTGLIKIAICNENGDILEIIGDGFSADLQGGYNYIYQQTISADLPETFGDGNYRLYLVAQQSGYNAWSKVTKYIEEDGTVVKKGIECFIKFWIVNGQVTYMNPNEEYYPDIMSNSLEDCSNLSSKVITVEASQLMNFSENDFCGYFSLALADTDGNIISVFGDPRDMTSSDLQQYYYYVNPQYLVGTLPEMEDGVFRVYVVARQEGYAQWAKVRKYVITNNSISDWGKEYFLTYQLVNGELEYVPEVLVQSITFESSSVNIYRGESITLQPIINPSNATNKSLTWKSSNTSVATVDENGVVYGNKKGTAKITATAQDDSGVSGSVTVTVKPVLVSKIELNYTSYSLEVGETVQLEASVAPDNADNKSVTWTSSNTAVATVSAGKVTAKGVGNATITAKTADGSNLTAQCAIEVITTPVTSISLNATSLDLYKGDTYQLTATVTPGNATDKSVVWSSDNNDVVIVSESGEVYANSQGTATVTATSADNPEITASCTINVQAKLYKLTYKVDGTLYKEYELEYGQEITPEPAPTKEGYSFSGWSEIPETMPARHVFVYGKFEINKYTITFDTDGGSEIAPITQNYGTTIVKPADPTKEGYTFQGWDPEIPETMPAEDMTIKAAWTINNYTLKYKVDGTLYKEYTLTYGAAITPEEEPTKDGYTFSGWTDIPETMPARNVTIYGSFKANKYTVSYYVEETLVHEDEVAFGETFELWEYVPETDDITFNGWIGEVYETMPAHDISYKADITSGIANIYSNYEYIEGIYTLDGKKVEKLYQGVYVIRMKDGTTRKFVAK